MVYAVLYSGDTVSQSILFVFPDLPLVDKGAERRGEADHGKELNTLFWTNGKGYTKIKKINMLLPVSERQTVAKEEKVMEEKRLKKYLWKESILSVLYDDFQNKGKILTIVFMLSRLINNGISDAMRILIETFYEKK